MSSTLDLVRKLIKEGDIKVSSHGYDELAEDHILVRDLISSVDSGIHGQVFLLRRIDLILQDGRMIS